MSVQELKVDLTVHPGTAVNDLKLEVVVVPVADVGRAKSFYVDMLGWRADADIARGDEFRIVQVTPPRSETSIQFGTNLTPAAPGSAQGLYLVVDDLDATRAELVERGVDVSEIFHEDTPGARFHPTGRAAGRSPQGSYSSFATFTDPDGNGWLLQEITTRLPGRIERPTTYASVLELEQALIRAAAAHGEHEQRTGVADAEWPAWYAAYMVKEQSGEELPT